MSSANQKNQDEKKLCGKLAKENLITRIRYTENKSTLKNISHSVFPSLNISIYNTKSKKYSEPLLKCQVPEPIYVSSEQPNNEDLCHRRTIDYFKYKYLLTCKQASYKRLKNKKIWKKYVRNDLIPTTVLDFAELLENNPDPYFASNYDWYFTGGNLICSSYENMFLHSGGPKLQELTFSRLKKKRKQNKLKPRHSLVINNYTHDDSEIFEIQSLILENNFSVRQKNSISLCSVEDDKLVCLGMLRDENVPFITSTSVLNQSNLFCTGNLDKAIHLWDVNQSSKHSKQLLIQPYSENSSNNWNCVRNLNENTFIFAGSEEFYLLDSRQSARKLLKNCYIFGENINLCEKISAVGLSGFSNICYFATTHKLLTVDIRNLRKCIDDSYIIQKWTHQMESTPLLLKTHKVYDNYELIALSSPISSDVRICENLYKVKNDSLLSNSLPFMPSSLEEKLIEVRKGGECLDPLTRIEERIRSCTTGLDFFSNAYKINLIRSNSLGDIFLTKVNLNDDDTEESYKNEILEYNDKIMSNMIPLPLNTTDLVDLNGVRKILRCKRLNVSEACDDEPIRPRRKMKWEQSVQELKAYKDVLASKLLSIWDVNDSIEPENITIEVEPNIKIVNNKVSNWLTETTEENVDFPKDFSFQNNLNVSTFLYDNAIDQSQQISTKIESQLTQSYVTGF